HPVGRARSDQALGRARRGRGGARCRRRPRPRARDGPARRRPGPRIRPVACPAGLATPRTRWGRRGPRVREPRGRQRVRRDRSAHGSRVVAQPGLGAGELEVRRRRWSALCCGARRREPAREPRGGVMTGQQGHKLEIELVEGAEELELGGTATREPRRGAWRRVARAWPLALVALLALAFFVQEQSSRAALAERRATLAGQWGYVAELGPGLRPVWTSEGIADLYTATVVGTTTLVRGGSSVSD